MGGTQFPGLLDVLRARWRVRRRRRDRQPRSPRLDLRTLYLKDLRLLGCTFQDDEVFENLVGYVERDEVRPVVAKSYPLSEIARAQERLPHQASTSGKLVLIPPPVAAAAD